jgi:hypothetical protein
MPRFVILTHDHPHLHCDLMLENEAGLRTFRLSRPPDPQGPVAAVPLGDHRLAYLDYEGPVSGNRGTVARWDRGVYTSVRLEEEYVEVVLAGSRCVGRAKLTRGPDGGWSLAFTPEQAPGTASR